MALDEQDTLVVLDGGGPAADRTEAIASAVEVTGARVARFGERELGEVLSVFPLTARCLASPWSWPKRAASAPTASLRGGSAAGGSTAFEALGF